MARRFIHTLSFPEHLWLDFFRAFFSQKTLLVDDLGLPVENNFRFEVSEIPENRRFDILLEEDLKANNPNILPVVVIEDMGNSSLGVALNRLSSWSVSPETSKTRSDLIRTTYVFHCAARTRGESRLLASIVANALTVFYDQLLQNGLHKIEPWAIGKTTPVKSDSDVVYVNTPVHITFEYQQTWRTIEDGPASPFRYCLRPAADELDRYVRTRLDIANAQVRRYVRMAMDLVDPNANIYVQTSLAIMDPATTEGYVRTSQNLANPSTVDGYIRTSMRLSA